MASRRLGRCKIVTLKTCWRRLQYMSWRRLQGVLKTNECLLGYYPNFLIIFILFFICFVSRSGNRKKIKQKKRWMGALQLLLYFFVCRAKPIMQKSNILLYGSALFACFCKSCSKKFCKFHRNIAISHRHFLNKKRIQCSRFSTNFVKCLKETSGGMFL